MAVPKLTMSSTFRLTMSSTFQTPTVDVTSGMQTLPTVGTRGAIS